MSPALHDVIGKFFIDLYGEHAGWAHTILFAADLRQFSDRVKTGEGSKKKAKSKK